MNKILIGIFAILIFVIIIQESRMQEYYDQHLYFSFLEAEFCNFTFSVDMDCDKPFLLNSKEYHQKLLFGNHTIQYNIMDYQDRRYCTMLNGEWNNTTKICTNMGMFHCKAIGGTILEKEWFFDKDKCMF